MRTRSGLFHDVRCQWKAAFSDSDGFGTHVPNFFNEGYEGVIVGGPRSRICGVEIGFDEHVLVCYGVDTQSVDTDTDAGCPVFSG